MADKEFVNGVCKDYSFNYEWFEKKILLNGVIREWL